jgi:hypothetical protein
MFRERIVGTGAAEFLAQKNILGQTIGPTLLIREIWLERMADS